jgi:SAM-dependent methyltransferase
MQVHGVDFSEDMIKIAKANAETSYLTPNTLPTFSVADIRNYVSGEKYELVFSLFHVINYMTTNTDLNKFFKTAHQSLLSGGLLVFDYWYGPAVLANPPTKRTREISWNGTRVVRYATPTLSSKENRVDVRYEFEIDQRDGTVLDSYEETHKMRFLFDDEIKAFSSGLFEQIVSFGWMTTTEPSELNWSAVTVLRKI